jgi:murein DD-endopeptidase MepM/ murein hydrolase activator NlpD
MGLTRGVGLLAVVAALVIGALVVPGGPTADAQAPAGPGSTTTTTTTTDAPTSTTTTTTPTGPTVTTTTLPGFIPVPENPTTTIVEDDPFASELLDGSYADQPAFDPASTQVVQAELVRAQRDLRDAERRGQRALDDVAAARARLGELTGSLAGRETEEQELVRQSQAAYALFVERAASAYLRGNDADLAQLFESEDANEFGKRSVLLESVLAADDAAFERYVANREAMSGELVSLHDQLIAATRDLKQARVVEKELRAEIVDLTIEVRVWEAGSQLMAKGFIFPVAGEVQFGDSWGAPRMPGTGYAHWHEGTDIMAAAGTPLVACEDGVISRTSSSTLGGMSTYILGESGIEYYYAHLSAYEPGADAGKAVKAGDVIGYVGDTGNAQGGAPHLHFEIHGRDGQAVNPYPILRIAHETQAIFAAISAPQ